MRRMFTCSVALISLAQRVLCGGGNLVPLSIPPSQYWDGNDGPWSTFGVQVGTPPQNVRVLPSTSSSSLWVVLPQGCTPNDPVDCWSLRGFVFKPNASSTWSDQGLFQLPLYPLEALGYSGNADYGFDNVTLAWQGQGGVVLGHQVVAGIATKDFYMGMLGLSPRPVNFTDFNHPEPSLLATLADGGQIPSASWAYTAGASYRAREPFGSLTLGGYDSARLTPNNLTFSFGPDTSRSFLIGVQDITTSGGAHLLPNGIVASVDSSVPHIWLPTEACQKFESTFGLVWDQATNLYLLNDTQHDALVAGDESITFKLGPSISGGDAVDIVLPYASFDLKYTSAQTNLTSRYFPLRRASNNTQYTFGRTFLQEASPLTPKKPPKHSLSPPIIAGIVIGAILLLILISLAAYRLRRHRRKSNFVLPSEMPGHEVSEVDAVRTHEMSETGILAEIGSYGTDSEPVELDSVSVAVELPGDGVTEEIRTSMDFLDLSGDSGSDLD
ncbi:MAG: hypothetical protein M1839_009465 [Geoglossum umbratile]|nr:MAG: hypothetical protein M1839_009465 [Geoglossum umbratile]